MKTELKNSISQLENSGESLGYKKKEGKDRLSVHKDRIEDLDQINKEYF